MFFQENQMMAFEFKVELFCQRAISDASKCGHG